MTTKLIRTFHCVVFALAAGTWTFSTHACEFDVKAVNYVGGNTIDYDVFDALDTEKILVVEIERIDSVFSGTLSDLNLGAALDASPNTGPGLTCDAKIRVIPSIANAALKGNKDVLNFELAANPFTTGPVTTGSTASQRVDGLIRNILPGEIHRWEFAILLPSEQIVTSGIYEAALLASVRPYNSTASQITDTITDTAKDELVRIKANVAPSARVSFAGVQGRNRIVDFGIIENGAKPIFQPSLMVQSTSGYRLRFSSDNKGNLVREGRGSNSTLPYDLQIEGETIDLGSPDPEVLVNTRSGVATDRVPLDFSIPNAHSKRAGVYRDRVVVNIVPLVQ